MKFLSMKCAQCNHIKQYITVSAEFHHGDSINQTTSSSHHIAATKAMTCHVISQMPFLVVFICTTLPERQQYSTNQYASTRTEI